MANEIQADEHEWSVVDTLVRDACESQRDQGLIPTPIDNRQFIQPIVEGLDRKPRPATPSATSKPMAIEAEYRRRGGQHFDAFDIKTSAPIVSAKKAKDVGSEMIARRLRLLKSKPEWMAKLKTINPLAINGVLGEDKKRESLARLWQILKDSTVTFGALAAEHPKPLWFT